MCADSAENDRKNLEQGIEYALGLLYKNDCYLIKKRINGRDDIHNSERGLVCKFSHYLQNYFTENHLFEDYNVDVEYNRNMDSVKYLPNLSTNPKGTYPDLIIHKRGSNEKNLLIAEFKTWWSDNPKKTGKKDKLKIKRFMDKNGAYRYTFGLFVVIGKESPELEWFEQS